MIISQTPLRISLCGGGTDLKGYYALKEGFVVSTTINKYAYVIIKRRFDDLIYVNYTQKEIVENIGDIKHDLVREAAKKAGLINGFEVTMLSDIPSKGSGLGSSSSFTVGLLNAFYQYIGRQVTAEQLAQEACEIEIDICGNPIGKQDQYIAAYGGLNGILFKKDDTVEVTPVKASDEVIRKLLANLSLFYTNVTRQASAILTEQKANIQDKLLYHDNIKELGFQALRSIEAGNIDEIGHLLAENWTMKKQLAANISNNSIDKMYDMGIESGALGGKVAGAGGGGFLMLYCQKAFQDQVQIAMKDYREIPFMYEPFGSRIILNYSEI